MSGLVFVDTWAWLALALRRDQFHDAAKRRHASLLADGRRYVTSDYVLGELATQLFRSLPAVQAEQFFTAILQGCDSGAYQLELVSPQRFAKAWEFRRRYADKPQISFVDLTSMAIMNEMGVADVFTGDAHFTHVNLGFNVLD
jgi:predicted nucleic acid-binding protein